MKSLVPTIIHRLIAHAEATPEGLVCAESDRSLELVRRITFGELLTLVQAGAARLRKIAIPGDGVLIFSSRGSTHLWAFLAGTGSAPHRCACSVASGGRYRS